MTESKAEVKAPPEFITAETYDSPECICKNTPWDGGFYPVTRDGKQVEPTPEEWPENLNGCADCGLIFDGDSYADGRYRVFRGPGPFIPMEDYR